MTSLSFANQKFSPRVNVFLLINLGSEMLYVVDQRLKAQNISEDKSFQVVHDIISVLLEPKFIESIIMGSIHVNGQLITAEHCKFMLKDAATCSLMRLDECSMEKLWNLMTMLLKWQLYVSKHPHHLIDITFRHLNEISKLYPDPKRNVLIDYTKNKLLDFWNATDELEQTIIYRTSIAWLQCFNTKISVLIRLGFQNLDGTFVGNVNANYYQEFVDTIGDNVYEKSIEIAAKQRSELNENINNHQHELTTAKYDVNQLSEILNSHSNDIEDLKPIDVTYFQQQFIQNLQQCNILFEDLDVNAQNKTEIIRKETKSNDLILDMKLFPDSTTSKNYGEFVQMKTVYNRENANNCIGNGVNALLTKDLLEFYSKLK